MRHQRYTRIRALLAGGLVLGIGMTATLAAWTDQEYAKTTIQAGTFSLQSQVSGSSWASNGAGSAVTLPLDATGLYPGVSKAAWIQIRTSGTLGGTVTLSGVTAVAPLAADQALRDALTVRVFTVTQTADCNTTAPGGASLPLTTAPSAGQLPPVTLDGSGGTTTTVTYCVVLTLPTGAPTSAQGGTVTPTWTFTGTTG